MKQSSWNLWHRYIFILKQFSSVTMKMNKNLLQLCEYSVILSFQLTAFESKIQNHWLNYGISYAKNLHKYRKLYNLLALNHWVDTVCFWCEPNYLFQVKILSHFPSFLESATSSKIYVSILYYISILWKLDRRKLPFKDEYAKICTWLNKFVPASFWVM